MAAKKTKGGGQPRRDETPAEPISGRGVMAAALALVIPGLGHLVLRRHGRAAVFFATVALMTGLGLAHDSGLAVPRSGEPLSYLATFGNLGIGPAYVGLFAGGFAQPQPDHAAYEYGSTYMLTAGLLNFLFMLDAYDIGAGRKS